VTDDNSKGLQLTGAEMSREDRAAQPAAFHPDDRGKQSEFSLHGCWLPRSSRQFVDLVARPEPARRKIWFPSRSILRGRAAAPSVINFMS